MALDTFLPEYFSQEFERPEMFEFPYLMFATDRSALVPAGGNQATWPDVEGSVTTQKYSRGTPLTDGEGQDAVLTLAVDQRDAVSIPLDDLDRVQRMPNLMAEYMIQGDRELMWDINQNLKNAYRSATRLAATGLTEPMRGDHDGLTSNVTALSVARASFAAAAFRQDLIEAMDENAGSFAKRHGWVSQDADTKGVVVCPIEIAAQFRRYLIDDKPNLGAGAIVDSAFGLGRIMKVSGWEVVEDVTAPPFNTAGAIAATAGFRLDFFHPQGRSLYYARQLAEMETERIQSQFGTRLKMLYLHGAVQGAARHLYSITVQLT